MQVGVAISVLSPVGTVVQLERSIVFVRGALGEENLNVVLLGLALTHAPWTRRSLTNERVFEKRKHLDEEKLNIMVLGSNLWRKVLMERK